jgi:hypothetical protein
MTPLVIMLQRLHGVIVLISWWHGSQRLWTSKSMIFKTQIPGFLGYRIGAKNQLTTTSTGPQRTNYQIPMTHFVVILQRLFDVANSRSRWHRSSEFLNVDVNAIQYTNSSASNLQDRCNGVQLDRTSTRWLSTHLETSEKGESKQKTKM